MASEFPQVGQHWQSGGSDNVWLVRAVDGETVRVERVANGCPGAVLFDAGHVYTWPIYALTRIGKRVDYSPCPAGWDHV